MDEVVCVVCGGPPAIGGVFVHEDELCLRTLKLHYALCVEHQQLPVGEVERWIRYATRDTEVEDRLPAEFGR